MTSELAYNSSCLSMGMNNREKEKELFAILDKPSRISAWKYYD